MPHETSSAEVWESRRVQTSKLAYRRLLISIPLFLLSIGVRQGSFLNTTKAALWGAWFVSTVLAILACVFAAEAAFMMQKVEKSDEMSFVSAVSRAVLWFAIFWIVYLSLALYLMIAPPSTLG